MRPSYSLTTAPTVEPFTLADMMREVKVDSDEEALRVHRLIGAARDYIERITGRAILTQTWTRRSDCFVLLSEDNHGRCMLLERTPVASVTSVKYYPYDGGAQITLTAGTHYRFHPNEESPGIIERIKDYDWPEVDDRMDAVEVVFQAGVATPDLVPKTLRHAVYHLVKHWVDAGADPVNVGNIVTTIPHTLEAEIMMFRVGGFVA